MVSWLRYTLSGILAAGFVTGMVFLVKETRTRHARLECSSIEVFLADDYRFLNEEDVKKLVLERYGNVEGKTLDSLDLSRIESLLDSQSAVLKSQAWTTDEGILHVSITQRKPEIRFLNGKEGFYVDATGYIFPLFERFTAECPLIRGPLPSDEQWISRTLDLVEYMKPYWMARTDSIGVNRKGQLSFRMDGGKEEYFFGAPDNFSTKFAKIKDYCEKIRPEGREYTKVDLTYTKQIICR